MYCREYSLEAPFVHENIYCGYSLEVPHWGTSNEYPQYMFSWRNKKNISDLWLKKGMHQENKKKLCYVYLAVTAYFVLEVLLHLAVTLYLWGMWYPVPEQHLEICL